MMVIGLMVKNMAKESLFGIKVGQFIREISNKASLMDMEFLLEQKIIKFIKVIGLMVFRKDKDLCMLMYKLINFHFLMDK